MSTKIVSEPLFKSGAEAPKVTVVREPAPVLTEADIPPILDQPPAMLAPACLWTIAPEMSQYIKDEHNRIVGLREAAGLLRPGRNRNMRWYGADNYARDMRTGNWLRNGSTISRAWNGVWPDGQHRVESGIKSGKPWETYVVFGIDLEAQDTIDTGIKRQVHDQLALQGEKNSKALDTTARWAWRWTRGARNRSSYAVPNPTSLEVLQFIKDDERLRIAAGWGLFAWQESDRLARPSVFAMAWLIFHGIDHLSAEVFLEAVATGANIGIGHPALTFRKSMVTAQRLDKRQTEHEQLALLITAWNAFRADKTISTLALPTGGLKPSNFPEPR